MAGESTQCNVLCRYRPIAVGLILMYVNAE